MSEQKRTSGEKRTELVWKTTAIASVIMLVLLIVCIIGWFYGYKSENMAYVADSAQLYAGPDESYAQEETISGYFAYQSEKDGWLILERKNSDGESVIRWVNTDDLTSWGEYRYKDTVEVAIATTE